MTNDLYNSITAITQKPSFIIVAIIVWLLPIIIWGLLGVIIRTKRGRAMSYMGSSPNFYYAFLLWGLFQALLFLIGLIFPVWALLLGN